MKNLVYLCVLVTLVFGCSDNSDGDFDGSGPGFDQDLPIGVNLVFPQQDSLCNEGEDPTPTESTVFFEWMPNSNAQSYRLTIENLASGAVSEFDTEAFIFPVTIARAVPFRWQVSYQFQGETKESALWNFYNEGPGVQNYAPFPAEIINPIMAQTINATSAVNLIWNGNDLDDDIVSYDVYFGTNDPPSLIASDLTETQFEVSVNPGTIYYWNIVSKDLAGHSSESGIYQFRVLD